MQSELAITPSHIIDEYSPLKCCVCGADLLSTDRTDHGLVVFVNNKDRFYHCYTVCKGTCDRTMDRHYFLEGFTTGYEEINHLLIPTFFISKVFSIIKQLQNNELLLTPEALEEYKTILLTISQYTLRHQSDTELETAKRLIYYSDL